MNTLALFWLVLFAIAAALFFGVATVITVIGVGDLRELLTRSRPDRGAGHASSGKPDTTV
jgi:hypothetical protein